MQSSRPSQVLRERATRHNKLMKYIKGYELSPAESKKLQRIKVNTMMEINIRYMRSQHNRYYKFPKNNEESEEQSIEEDDPIAKHDRIYYDLAQQNQFIKQSSPQRKSNSLDNGRRVFSLQIERNNQQRNRILRFQVKSKNTVEVNSRHGLEVNSKHMIQGKSKHTVSTKSISRKNSLADKNKRENSRLKLPELKAVGHIKTIAHNKPQTHTRLQGQIRQDGLRQIRCEGRGEMRAGKSNLKTEVVGRQQQVQSVIGKKLQTQSSSPSFKLKGVEKYLKKMQLQQKESQAKSTFRRKALFEGKA